MGIVDDLEALIRAADAPAVDDQVRDRVKDCRLLVLGAAPKEPGDDPGLLRCTVPVGNREIEMLPVFTRLEYVDEAIRWNPSWEALDVLDMHGSAIIADLDYDEWLGINPWSITEFKLPPRSSYWNV